MEELSSARAHSAVAVNTTERVSSSKGPCRVGGPSACLRRVKTGSRESSGRGGHSLPPQSPDSQPSRPGPDWEHEVPAETPGEATFYPSTPLGTGPRAQRPRHGVRFPLILGMLPPVKNEVEADPAFGTSWSH